jgi:hypothetical protein
MSEIFIAALGITASGRHEDRTPKHAVAKAPAISAENACR